MIEVNIKMKNDKYDHIIETLFTTYSSLKKDTNEHYYTNEGDLGNIFGRCNELMEHQWFRDNVEKFTWVVEDEDEEDLIKGFTKLLIEEGKL